MTEREHVVQILRHMSRAFLSRPDVTPGPLPGSVTRPWCEFVERCSRSNGQELRSVVVPLLGTLSEHPEQLSPTELANLGEAARRVLTVAWQQDRRDRTMVGTGLRAVCRTFKSNPGESAALIRQALERNHLIEYCFEEMPILAREVTHLIPTAPELVEEIYRVILSYDEPSDEATPLGSGRIMPLQTNRRQEYQGAQHQLGNSFRAFLDQAPLDAVGALIAVVEAQVLDRATVEAEDYPAEAIEIGGRQGRLAADASSIWDMTTQRHEAIYRMLDQFEAKLVELAGTPSGAPVIGQLLDRLAKENRFAAVWRRVLASGAKSPNSLGKEIRSLAWSQAVLKNADTKPLAGEFLKAVFSTLENDDRDRVERAILGLPSGLDEEHREYAERSRDQLLRCLPLDAIVTADAGQRRQQLESSGGPPPNEPDFSFSDRIPAGYDEDRVLAGRGVPVDSDLYRRARELGRPLRELTGRHLNSAPSREEAEGVSVALRQLHHLVGTGSLIATLEHFVPFVGGIRKAVAQWRGKEIHPSLEEMSWTDLSSVCTRIAKGTWFSPDLPIGKLVREILLEASFSEYPHPPEDEEEEFDGGFSWRYTPRSDAAEGLAFVLEKTGRRDYRVLRAIERLARDKLPLVRYQVASFLEEVYRVAPNLAWQLFRRICRRERSFKVLLNALADMSGAISREPATGRPLLWMVFHRAAELKGMDDLRNRCVSLCVNIIAKEGDPFAGELVRQILADVAEYPAQAAHLARIASKHMLRGPVMQAEPAQDLIRKSAISALVRIAGEVRNALKKIEERHSGIAFDTWPEEDRKRVEKLLSVADDLSKAVYFDSGADDEGHSHRVSRKTPQNPETKKRFLDECGVLLDLIAELSHPQVVHSLLETLKAYVPIDPAAILIRIGKTVRGGRRGGYEFESLAAGLVVGIVRRYLAEYRYVFRENAECRAVLIEILDTFIKAGWPEAQRVTYQLEEIFR